MTGLEILAVWGVLYTLLHALVWALEHKAAGYKIVEVLRITGFHGDRWIASHHLLRISGVSRSAFYVRMSELLDLELVQKRPATVNPHNVEGLSEYQLTPFAVKLGDKMREVIR